MSPRSGEPGAAGRPPDGRPTYCRLHFPHHNHHRRFLERLPSAGSGPDRPHSLPFPIPLPSIRKSRTIARWPSGPVTPRDQPGRTLPPADGPVCHPAGQTDPPTAVPGSPPVPATPPSEGVPVPPGPVTTSSLPADPSPGSAPSPTGHFPVPPQAPVRTPPPSAAYPATGAAGYAEFGTTTWVRQPVACKPAPISPDSVPRAPPISSSSAPNRPARAAQTVAVRHRIRPPCRRRPRAAARSSNRPMPTTSSPLWPGRPQGCPAHSRWARQPAPPRRWHRPERAWRSAS